MYAYLFYYVNIVRFCTYICIIYIYIQWGSTALIVAAVYGHIEMADLLIRSNADVNGRDGYGVRTNTIYIIYIIP